MNIPLLHNDLSNVFIIILISLNLLLPNTFTGNLYQITLVAGGILSYVTYHKLKRENIQCKLHYTLSKINKVLILGMFICFIIVFVNHNILYDMWFLAFYLIYTGIYLGFITTRIFINYEIF